MRAVNPRCSVNDLRTLGVIRLEDDGSIRKRDKLILKDAAWGTPSVPVRLEGLTPELGRSGPC